MKTKAYAEVEYILNQLGKEYIDKIPKKLLALINRRKLKYYVPRIDINKSIYEQDVERETLILLTLIYHNYWCESDEERRELFNTLSQ